MELLLAELLSIHCYLPPEVILSYSSCCKSLRNILLKQEIWERFLIYEVHIVIIYHLVNPISQFSKGMDLNSNYFSNSKLLYWQIWIRFSKNKDLPFYLKSKMMKLKKFNVSMKVLFITKYSKHDMKSKKDTIWKLSHWRINH
jgi:hypothetical protein